MLGLASEQGTALPPLPDIDILGLTADSRQVRPGYLFAALPGAKADGLAFVPAALAAGASALLVPMGAGAAIATHVPVIEDEAPRRRFARMAAAFAGAQPATVVAVTGTNGKTSTVRFAEKLWTHLGLNAASLGTLGVSAPAGLERPGSLTTPDPVTLHGELARLAQGGVTHAAMEASSHGLDQSRLDGVTLTAAAFTNLTRDHLDYHGTLDAYRTAKLRLFEALLPPGAAAVVNAESEEAPAIAAIAARRALRLIDYGAGAAAIRLVAATPSAHGQSLTLELWGARHTVALPLAGRFQAMNALAALGLVLADESVDRAAALAGLTTLNPVPGRLQLVGTATNGAPVFVDYAHTPDALETLLTALRPHATGRLIVVFGAGGDRDPGKRPLMGAVAGRLADHVIVTDDNPRGEDPAAIRAQVRAGLAVSAEIGDRAAAIEAGLRALGPGDVLAVAGKGHETGQTVRGVTLPFDDAQVIRELLA